MPNTHQLDKVSMCACTYAHDRAIHCTRTHTSSLLFTGDDHTSSLLFTGDDTPPLSPVSQVMTTEGLPTESPLYVAGEASRTTLHRTAGLKALQASYTLYTKV